MLLSPAVGKKFFTISQKNVPRPTAIVKVLACQGDKIDLEALVNDAFNETKDGSMKSYLDMMFLRAYGASKDDGKLRVFAVPQVEYMRHIMRRSSAGTLMGVWLIMPSLF